MKSGLVSIDTIRRENEQRKVQVLYMTTVCVPCLEKNVCAHDFRKNVWIFWGL